MFAEIFILRRDIEEKLNDLLHLILKYQLTQFTMKAIYKHNKKSKLLLSKKISKGLCKRAC